jgi:hypothetical protein
MIMIEIKVPKTRSMEYDSSLKPIRMKSGTVHYDNMSKNGSKWLYGIGDVRNYEGYSGVAEYEYFPLRQLFVKRNNRFPNEWDTGFFTEKDISTYVNKNKAYILAGQYNKDGIKFISCIIKLPGKEDVFLYIRNASYYKNNENQWCIAILFGDRTKKVDDLISFWVKKIIPEKDEKKGYIHILIKTESGYNLEAKKITCPDIDFSLNYNADFLAIHNLIKRKLSIDKSKGLILLHGEPGTGKTTYIRYLANSITKKIIYIPPNMISVLSDPELIKFFITNSNTILLIEDAENILMKRERGSTQAIANLLNLTDGLLSDCTNIQVVATFNTDLGNIDKALLRKGRLIAKYEFKELSEDRAIKLCKKLKTKISNKSTLAEIYNSEDISFEDEKEKIGFKSGKH